MANSLNNIFIPKIEGNCINLNEFYHLKLELCSTTKLILVHWTYVVERFINKSIMLFNYICNRFKMIKENIHKNEWQNIILGIRYNYGLSQAKMSKNLGLGRQTISRFECEQRIPDRISQRKILEFIDSNNINIKELIKIGKKYAQNYFNRQKKSTLNLKPSEELAELMGILLGDGEIRKDGTIRISYDPKKDVNFLMRRIFYLNDKILGNKIGFESEKRISFGNIAFVRYLETIEIPAGSKFDNNVQIPKLFFKDKSQLCSVLRGLFDTDGYFGYLNGSLEIMLGRFSVKSIRLVDSICLALKKLGIKHKKVVCNDGQFKIRMSDKLEIIKFFKLIGSSNLRNIIRFLLWRINKYEAKIEKEGFQNLVKKTQKNIYYDIQNIKLPFLWNSRNKLFQKFINEDEIESKGSQLRGVYDWPRIMKLLIRNIGQDKLSNQFKITKRSVRKWREGTRIPSKKFIINLIKLMEENNMKLNKYKVIENG